jgi:hypothetical protein
VRFLFLHAKLEVWGIDINNQFKFKLKPKKNENKKEKNI